MKLFSSLAGIVYGFVSMILIPLIIIDVNSLLHLPVYQSVLFQVAGFLFVLSGGLLLICSTYLFAKLGKGGSPLPFDPPKKLVIEGIYKYIRNPMFTASALIWLGEFLFFGSILLLPYAVVWIVANHLHLIFQDEKWLEQRYGEEYLEYKKKTPRYMPKLV